MVEVGPSGLRADRPAPVVLGRPARSRGKLVIGLILAVLVIVLDQITKSMALGQFAGGAGTNSRSRPSSASSR